jgi:hypothetical protein
VLGLAQYTTQSRQQADYHVDHTRFIAQWNSAHTADAQFEATFPTNHVELPSPYMNGYLERGPPHVNGVAELPSQFSPELQGSLPPVAEPRYNPESERTP